MTSFGLLKLFFGNRCTLLRMSARRNECGHVSRPDFGAIVFHERALIAKQLCSCSMLMLGRCQWITGQVLSIMTHSTSHAVTEQRSAPPDLRFSSTQRLLHTARWVIRGQPKAPTLAKIAIAIMRMMTITQHCFFRMDFW